MADILIIDDEESITWSLRKAFERQGHVVEVASNAEAGFAATRRKSPNLIILDIRLPGIDGLSAFQELQKLSDHCPIIVITAHGNLDTAVKAVELGAHDYISKPFRLVDIQGSVDRALQWNETTASATTERDEPLREEIIGKSLAMQAVFKRIALVAPSDASVLITGESGTGKELVARAVHRYSSRNDKPFMPVHIAAMNPNLVESELFGHIKGAFTGADKPKTGLLALANGGTVFLDELGDIPLPVQAKLLRVLERQEVIPVGGSFPEKINVRILAATHAHLQQQVKAGQFRHDLYFRLNVFEIHLPNLSDRSEDIPLLAEHFLKGFGSGSILSPEALTFLKARRWPGNVRELRNALEHAAIIARGQPLLPEHFPTEAGEGPPAGTSQSLFDQIRSWIRQESPKTETNLYDRTLELFEPILLDEVLQETDHNRVAAARKLGLARATLRKLMTKYRGAPEEEEESLG